MFNNTLQKMVCFLYFLRIFQKDHFCLFSFFNSLILGDGPPVVQKLDLGSSKKTTKKKTEEETQKKEEIITQKPTTSGTKNSPHFYASTVIDISSLRRITTELKG